MSDFSVSSLLGRSGSFDVVRYSSDADKIQAIISTICKRARSEYRVSMDVWDLERCIQSVGIYDVDGQARFNKRVFKWFSDNITAYKLPSDLGGIIGGVHKDVISAPAVRLYWSFGSVWDFQNDVDEGGRGFGNDGSCWLRYGCASGSPYVLDNAGGCGFYVWRDDDEGGRISCGRLWVVNDLAGRLAVFNPYLDLGTRGGSSSSFDNLTILLSVLVGALGGSDFNSSDFNFKVGVSDYCFKSFYAYGSTDTIYINDTTVWVLGLVGGRFDFDNPFEYEGSTCCEHCEDRISEDEAYEGADGCLYCEDCFNRLFVYCNHCGEIIWRGDAYEGADGWLYCEDCFNRLFVVCDDCGEIIWRDNALVGSDGCLYCSACVPVSIK